MSTTLSEEGASLCLLYAVPFSVPGGLTLCLLDAFPLSVPGCLDPAEASRSVFIRNLPAGIKQTQIAEYFGQFGKVKLDRIQIRQNKVHPLTPTLNPKPQKPHVPSSALFPVFLLHPIFLPAPHHLPPCPTASLLLPSVTPFPAPYPMIMFASAAPCNPRHYALAFQTRNMLLWLCVCTCGCVGVWVFLCSL